MTFPSPLRYPGGKKKLSGFIKDAIVSNGLQGGIYVEPFAGGASIAWHLLFNEYASSIIINDLDKSIYAFWYSVLYETDKLCKLISDTPVTIEEWETQRLVQKNKENADYLTLGFSTFFLNRTNRSGIIKGGIIGGKEQSGKWKMDVRFNKQDLIKRIEKIALYSKRIEIHNQDAIAFINSIRQKLDGNSLIYFDPPYYNQGAALYANYYTKESHKELAEFIQGLEYKWILTYDYTPNIIELYKNVEKRLLTLNYTAAQKTKGCEMIAFCNDFIIPEGIYSAITVE